MVVAAAAVGAIPTSDAEVDRPPLISEQVRVPMSDGVELAVHYGGRAGPDGRLPARPTVVEMSPYGDGCCGPQGGDDLNHLFVQIRGTGASDGTFDALGPRTQQDLAEVMGWACAQPWSAGRLGLYGFSASAIVVYNSLHLELPCLAASVLGAGTHELYRDLLDPGGIPNAAAAAGVLAMIGGPALAQGLDRLERAPGSVPGLLAGFGRIVVDYLVHPSLDDFWHQRGWRGDVNHAPTLVVNGFYDVESRGAFEGFQALRDAGTPAHLYVVGAHEGSPAGTGGATEVTRRWFERHLAGVANGVEDEPTVQLWLSNGDRVRMADGDFTTLTAQDWPMPGTTWTSWYLRAERSGTAPLSTNDGTLSLEPNATASHQLRLGLPSLATATDVPTTALLGVFDRIDLLVQMDVAQALGMAFTTEPFATDVVAVGPGSVELALTGVLPESDLWVVLSDVWPDGSAHPVATGRLRTSYPDLDLARSRRDEHGTIVQPTNDLSRKRFVGPLQEHRYFVELWPIGNRFAAGHRLRLHVVGASLLSLPTLPGVEVLRLGGADGGSVLRLPVAPAADP